MKKLICQFSLILLIVPFLLAGCSSTTVSEPPETGGETVFQETAEAETEQPAPVLIPSNYEISSTDAQNILTQVELALGNARVNPYTVIHGGQQMRVCRTDRGIYTAFMKFFDDTAGGDSEFYVAKIDNNNNVSLLYYGKYYGDASTVLLNIGQDSNGDIVVTTATMQDLNAYIIDAETDAVSEYSALATFTSGYQPSYSQVMFDFTNRKIYAFYAGCMGTNLQVDDDYLLEWFSFDLDARQWNAQSTYYVGEDLGRHSYLFPFPDGNGGAYIIGERDVHIDTISEQLFTTSTSYKYVFDTLRMFHIPDLSTAENVTNTVIHAPYTEKGLEGIWSVATNNQYGGVFMDKDGYMHITYQYYIYDLDGDTPDLDQDIQYRHAVYNGMECVFNEKLTLPEEDNLNYKPMITQSSDGTLYMIVCEQYANPSVITVYKAEDTLGTSWALAKSYTLDGIGARSFSISEARSGSLTDDVVTCFFYGDTQSVHTFTLSLKDLSVTPVLDILEDFDIVIDEVVYYKAYNTAHPSKIVHTENGAYAAFVYKYEFNKYSVYNCTELFCIVKIAPDNTVSLLYTGSYQSAQDRYLNIQQLSDGKIYVFQPHGEYLYIIDPADDSVTEQEVTLKPGTDFAPQQVIVIHDTAKEKDYALTVSGPGYTWYPDFIRVDSKSMNLEDVSFAKRAKMLMSDNGVGYYTDYYFFPDGADGAYAVASKQVDPHYVESLTFVGRIDSLNDTISLLHFSDLNKNSNIEIVDIQAPYTAEAANGIWSVVNMADYGDAYMDSDGKLHIFYSYHHIDLDDMDSRGNAALKTNTLKYYHAIYNGMELVSCEELILDGLSENAAVRMAEMADGTDYLLVCGLGEENTTIRVYFQAESGWALTAVEEVGSYTAESFSISSPRNGSARDGLIDCLIYGTDDVYYTCISFE